MSFVLATISQKSCHLSQHFRMTTTVRIGVSWVFFVHDEAFGEPGYHSRASGRLHPVGGTLHVLFLKVLLAKRAHTISGESVIPTSFASVQRELEKALFERHLGKDAQSVLVTPALVPALRFFKSDWILAQVLEIDFLGTTRVAVPIGLADDDRVVFGPFVFPIK